MLGRVDYTRWSLLAAVAICAAVLSLLGVFPWRSALLWAASLCFFEGLYLLYLWSETRPRSTRRKDS